MADALPDDAQRLQPIPRVPYWSRRWVGFPAVLPPFLGRERAVAALASQLRRRETHLVTLTGPGGVGKTRLALAVAEEIAAEFDDGAVFVSLASITDPALVLPAIARALDIRETPRQPPLRAIAEAARHRRLLLVLDNVEHLLSASPDLARLLEAWPRLTILATSRAPLRLTTEQRVDIPPLAVPAPGKLPALDHLAGCESVALFVERARAARHDFALHAENAPAISAICQRLDGLPLAIELAAAWVRVLPSAVLLARLERRLDLLHGGAADQPARLRTMRDAIAWSYDRLTAPAQALFRRLAIFVGGFTLEAAEAVNPPITHHPSPITLDLIAALVDASLVQLVATPEDGPRYQMLETLREFALERLAASGEAEAVAASHAAVMRDLAERAEPVLLGPDEQAWHARVDAELGNLRAALAWSLEHEADAETALRIAAALWAYWSWGQLAEGRRWLAAALERPAQARVPLRARALTTDAALAMLAGDFASGLAQSRAAVELAQVAGDPLIEARARWINAGAWTYTDQLEAGVPELDRALVLFDQATTPADRAWAAYARSHRADTAWLSDPRQGLALHEEALAQARAAGSDCVTLIVLGGLTGWLIDRGEMARARGLLHEALAFGAGHRERWLVAWPLLSLALIATTDGEAATAARRLGATAAVMQLAGMEIPTLEQARIDRAAAVARDALGAEAFTMAWEAGRADPGAVIAEALGIAGDDDTDGSGEAAAYGLTPRESEVLRHLADGRTDKEIAAQLFVTRRTASKHVAAILHKLGVDSRTAAVALALRRGLLGPLPGHDAPATVDSAGASGANGEYSP